MANDLVGTLKEYQQISPSLRRKRVIDVESIDLWEECYAVSTARVTKDSIQFTSGGVAIHDFPTTLHLQPSILL